MGKLGFQTDGSPGGVKVLKQGFNVDPLLQKQADCISTMTYNEYWQVIDAGYKPDQLVVFNYADQGVATLEDGLYVMEDKLKDPAFVDKMARFVRASMKGWDYARAHPTEAVKIVLDNDPTGAQTEHHQTQMMGEVNKLTAGSDGRLDLAAYRAHGQGAAQQRRLRPRDLEGARRRLYDGRHRRGVREEVKPPALSASPLSFWERGEAKAIGNSVQLPALSTTLWRTVCALEFVKSDAEGIRSGLEGAPSAAKRSPFIETSGPIGVRANAGEAVFPRSDGADKSLEDDVNEFLESQRPHVTHVSVSLSDVEEWLPSGTKSRIIGRSNKP